LTSGKNRRNISLIRYHFDIENHRDTGVLR